MIQVFSTLSFLRLLAFASTVVSAATVDNRCSLHYPSDYVFSVTRNFTYFSANELAVFNSKNITNEITSDDFDMLKFENDCFERCKFNPSCVAFLWTFQIHVPFYCKLYQKGNNEKLSSSKYHNFYTMSTCPHVEHFVEQTTCKTKYANDYSWRISHQGDMSGFHYYQANKLVDLRFVDSVDECFEECISNATCVAFMWGTAARCTLYQKGHQETKLASGKTYDFYTVGDCKAKVTTQIKIKDGNTDMCVSIDGNKMKSGQNIQLRKCSKNNKGQTFIVKSNGLIRVAAKPEYCVIVKSDSAGLGTNIELGHCNENDNNQYWTVENNQLKLELKRYSPLTYDTMVVDSMYGNVNNGDNVQILKK
eukprot:Pgem_evm1s20161